MKCLRCQGATVEEWIATENDGGFFMIRCLNCGDIIDDVVILNRLNALAKLFHETSVSQ